MRTAFQTAMRQPSILIALLCYLVVIWAIVAGSNSAQDATRQRQIDRAEIGIEAHVTREVNRAIEIIGNRGN